MAFVVTSAHPWSVQALTGEPEGERGDRTRGAETNMVLAGVSVYA